MIRYAIKEDLLEIVEIYDAIHDAEEAGSLTIGWKRGVYPTLQTAEQALDAGHLFVFESNGRIYASAIINHCQCECYKYVKWSEDAPEDKVLVLHTMTVSPEMLHSGIGRQFMEFFEKMASESGCEWVRLDTQTKNVNPRSFYLKIGYTEVDVVKTTGFNGLGEVELALFEKPIVSK